MPFVSIIMPIYNSELFLPAALESILNQTFKDFELILINDGSSDNSSAICDQYKERDKRIIVVHQKNKGISAARNKGIEIAQGEYLTFCDNDDEFKLNLLEDNLKLAINEDADVVKYGIEYIYINSSNKEKNVNRPTFDSGTYNKKQLRPYYKQTRKKDIFTFIWNGLYKSSIIKLNNIEFDNKIRHGGEDSLFNIQLLSYVEKIVINDNKYYVHYRRETHSTTERYEFDRIEAVEKHLEEEYKFYMENSLDYKRIWLELALIQLTSLSIYIFDKRANLTKKKQIELLNYYLTKKQFYEIRNLNYFCWISLIRKNKKYGVISFLYCKKMYSALRLLYKWY